MTDTTTAPSVSPSEPTSTQELNQTIPFSTSDLGADVSAVATPGVPDTDAQEYGFDDENVRQYEFDLYKGQKNYTDRICILAPPYGARVHFKQGIGYFICFSVFKTKVVNNQKIEECVRRSPCCLHSDPPRKRFIVPIVQYGTAPNGSLLPQFSYSLKAWLYSDDKYAMMKTIHSEFPLLEHDLLVTWTDDNFKKCTIAATKQALWKNDKLPPNIAKDITTWVEVMRPKMAKKIGRKITELEFMQKAGLASSPAIAAGTDAPMMDVAHLLDN